MSQPWNDWYHVMWHTHGTWLPGDPRGFRTRHHREHVEGDYKRPPPKGAYDALHQRSKELMKREPVELTVPQRKRAVEEVARSFCKWRIDCRIVSIDAVHGHAITRVPDHAPRHYVGLAKKESSAYMQRANLAPPGGLWAVRCKCLPIEDAAHFEAAADYIRKHGKRGAAIWEPDQTIDIDLDSLLLD